MPCKPFRGQLSLYAGGDLEAPQSEIVRDHVTNCPSCREQVASFEKSRSLLGSYAREVAQAPQAPDVSGGVMGRLQS